MLDLAILGLLEEQDLHGYEIRRQLRGHLGLLANVSFGSLYPALARLERSGAVEAIDPPRRNEDPPPPTGSLSGEWAVLRARRRELGHRRRSRKVYRVTEAGSRLFAELLAEGGGPGDTRSFALRWAFARHLTPGGRRALLQRRRLDLTERLAEVETAAGDRRLDGYGHAVVEHAAETLRHDISWLDRLLEAEGVPPQDPLSPGPGPRPPATAASTR